jgi:HlyD family secretion protein
MIRDTSAQDAVIDPAPAQRRRRRLVLGGVAAAALCAAAVSPALTRWSSADLSVDGSQLRYATVTRSRFVSDVAVQGQVVAAVSPTLYAATAGTVSTSVNAGDKVSKGQPLAAIDSPELLSEFGRERSTLLSLQAAFERQRIQTRAENAGNQQTVDLALVTLKAAERELERYRNAFQQGLVSRQEHDRREDQLAEAQVRYEHAVQNAKMQAEKLSFELRTSELDVERQRGVVANFERRVDELTVRSPVDGMVGSIAVQQRAAVTPNQPLLTVVDLSVFEIELAVPESYADDLALDMPAEITYGSSKFPGRLTSISPEVRNSQVVGRVRFAGDAPADLRQNQRVSVRIVLEEKPDALIVDRGAFFESGGGRVAYKVDDGVAHRTPIATGASSIAKVEITQGLAEGDQIVISSLEPFGRAETVLIRN